MKNLMEPNELHLVVHRLSNEAFQLAQQYASGTGDLDKLAEHAREVNARLDTLWPLIQKLDVTVQADLSQAWSDARMDADYVLSGGELSTSTRLYYYLQGLKSKK